MKVNKRLANELINNHHKKFLDSITDLEIKEILKTKCLISGGAIASLLTGQEVKDYDYYLTDFESCRKVACYFVNKFNELNKDKDWNKSKQPFVYVENGESGTTPRVKIMIKSAGIASEAKTDGKYQYFEGFPDQEAMTYVDQATSHLSEDNETPSEEGEEQVQEENNFSSIQEAVEQIDSVDASTLEAIDETGDKKKDKERPKFRPIFLSQNAITLSEKTQIVIRFYGSPEEVHKNYDFVHCTNYWLASDKNLHLNQEALECLLSKTLIYQGSLYPICSIIRARKFLQRGWWINAGQYLKMCMQISGMNLTNPKVLEEQLTGVDTAYMWQVINYCKSRQAEDRDFQLTTPYLISIIDKIF